MTITLRPVWKYVPEKCWLSDIKKGDLYRFEKAEEDDNIDPDRMWIATCDAFPSAHKPGGSCVEAIPLIEDPSAPDPAFPPTEIGQALDSG